MSWMYLIKSQALRFSDGESGAVTVDWVVGAAAGVGLAIAISNVVGGATHDHAELIGDTMSSRGIITAY